MILDPKISKHVFICERCSFPKENGECSDPAEAKAFRKRVKEKAKNYWSKEDVRINGSGCLGQCERGISCVIYPEGRWLLNLRLIEIVLNEPFEERTQILSDLAKLVRSLQRSTIRISGR